MSDEPLMMGLVLRINVTTGEVAAMHPSDPRLDDPDWDLIPDGRVVSREDFPDLYDLFGAKALFGQGEEPGTFRLPDLRARPVSDDALRARFAEAEEFAPPRLVLGKVSISTGFVLLAAGCAECRFGDYPPLMTVVGIYPTVEEAQAAASDRPLVWKAHPQGGLMNDISEGAYWIAPVMSLLAPESGGT